jgi:hypothetical protein
VIPLGIIAAARASGPTGSDPFQHWRLYVTAVDGGSYVSFGEIELLSDTTDWTDPPVNLTATQSGDGAVGSASAGASNDPDDECGSSWSGGPYWWQVDLGSARSIDSMSLRSQRVVTGRTPTAFILQGSASSSGPWTDVITVTGSTGWGVKERRVFPFT